MKIERKHKPKGPRIRDLSINQELEELSGVYNKYYKSEGQEKAEWQAKWYDKLNKIAASIRQLRQD